MSLIEIGNFKLHSGDLSDFKIDCDFLSDKDIFSIAYLLSKKLQPYNHVVGIPRGGLRLADAMREFVAPNASSSLVIVDDVLTTGSSMLNEYRLQKDHWKMIQGAVIFDRREYYELYGNSYGWIRPLFQIKLT